LGFKTLAKITFPPEADLPMADNAKLSFILDLNGEIAIPKLWDSSQ